MKGIDAVETVSARAWPAPTSGDHYYGDHETYRLAALWMESCAAVDDWGGGFGVLRQFLKAGTAYRLIDGTAHGAVDVLTDLRAWRESADGIVLRHVLDCTQDWQLVLANAIMAFRKRLVVVTYTPDAAATGVVRKDKGFWPLRRFNPGDLRQMMGTLLVQDYPLYTTHPERVYFLEKPS